MEEFTYFDQLLLTRDVQKGGYVKAGSFLSNYTFDFNGYTLKDPTAYEVEKASALALLASDDMPLFTLDKVVVKDAEIEEQVKLKAINEVVATVTPLDFMYAIKGDVGIIQKITDVILAVEDIKLNGVPEKPENPEGEE
jgi:hypothetical protein